MKRATPEDKTTVINILSESFEQNKSVLSIVNHRIELIPKLMAYSFDKAMIFGEVWLNDDSTAALVILKPESGKFSLKSLLLDIRLLLSVIGILRVLEILNRENQIKKRQPKTEFIHLWYIGVKKAHQGLGLGSQLLNNFLKLEKIKNLPIYLETSTLENLNFYKSIGFQIKDKIVDVLPYTLYILTYKKLN